MDRDQRYDGQKPLLFGKVCCFTLLGIKQLKQVLFPQAWMLLCLSKEISHLPSARKGCSFPSRTQGIKHS